MTKAYHSEKGKLNLKEIAAYKYDYRGLLVQKEYSDYVKSDLVEIDSSTSNILVEYYEYTPDGKLLYTERENGSATDYIWAEQTIWCEIQGNEVYYHCTDHLGTTEVITDSTGTVVWEASYGAFGSVLSENGSMAFTPSFTGKMLDECNGLYYFNARWYDSEIGRFTTQDPARDGSNWYGYCGQNSLTYVDPDGIIKFKIGVSANAGAGVGGNLESGFVIGFSKERKITIGVYTSESLGSEFGATAFFGLVIGIDLASDEVKTENTTSMTIGGSADGGLGIGLDLSMDTDTKEIDLS